MLKTPLNHENMNMRFLDQIDADSESIKWISGKSIELGADRIEHHNHEYSGCTRSAWKCNDLLATTVVLRDGFNWSILVCHVVAKKDN